MPEFDSAIEYRDISGFPGYKVGSDGSVWSCHNTDGSGLGGAWRPRLTKPDKQGYRIIKLQLCAKSHYRKVHRLVLEAFVGPCPDGLETRHLDGRKSNNALSNLKWGTSKENKEDSVCLGSTLRGEQIAGAVLSDEIVREVLALYATGKYSQRQLAERYGVGPRAIQAALWRKTWKHVEPNKERVRRGRIHGEKHGRAILCEAAVKEIRATHQRGGTSERSLAKQYGVSRQLIGRVLRREVWKCV